MMAKALLTVLLLSCLNATYAQDVDKSSNVNDDQHTCWGNKIRPPEDGGTVSIIHGKVVDPNGESVPDALIEIYEDLDLEIKKRKRVAVRRTGAGGEFSFKGLRPGRYELRASFCSTPGFFDAGHTIINYAPKDRSSSKIEILVKLTVSEVVVLTSGLTKRSSWGEPASFISNLFAKFGA